MVLEGAPPCDPQGARDIMRVAIGDSVVHTPLFSLGGYLQRGHPLKGAFDEPSILRGDTN